MLCDVASCDRTVATAGLCGAHYQRKRKYGDVQADRPLMVRDGRSVMASGYVRVWAPGHPMANADGYALEHRKVLFDAGVDVPEGHHVHHLNGNKTDNRRENLAVIDEAEHHRHHAREAGFVVNQYGTWPLRNSVVNVNRFEHPVHKCDRCGGPTNDLALIRATCFVELGRAPHHDDQET